MERGDIILEMYRRGMIKFGRFILTSGRESPYYIDLRILPSYPKLYRSVMEELAGIAENIDYDVVAGIETSGIVHASYLGCMLSKPIAYVRKKPKGHGTRSLVEGLVEDRRVLLVDDVVTTGNTLINAVKSIEACGGRVVATLVIIDRCEGAVERLARHGIKLYYLYTSEKIIEYLFSRGLINVEYYKRVKEYMENSRRKNLYTP